MTSPHLILAGVAALALAGCVGAPHQYETVPVSLETPKGPVVCQLYNLNTVIWDRSIDRPNNMDVQTADQLCRNEGYRIIRAGEARGHNNSAD